MEVNKDVMKSHEVVKNNDNTIGEVYHVNNNKEGENKYMSSSNNIDVEFSADYLQKEASGSATVLQTDHDHDHVNITGTSKMTDKWFQVVTSDHSHLGNSLSIPTPSGFDRFYKKTLPTSTEDRNAAQVLEKCFPGVTSRIYLSMVIEYIRYHLKKIYQ
jgi:hypothetical protein